LKLTTLRAHAKHPRVVAIAAMLFTAVIFLVLARDYLPFFADDGFISLRYAHRLLDGQGLTWNDGERVEGYSNLLWVLGCATIASIGVELVDAARLLGQATGLAAIAGLMTTYRGRAEGWRPAIPALTSGLVLALSGSLTVWAVGGLEQPMVAACLAWGLFLVFRRLDQEDKIASAFDKRGWLLAGLPFALLCWTRPDGPLIASMIALGVAASSRFARSSLRRIPWLLLLPALFVGAQLIFRLAYYGAWIPNSGSAKLAFTVERWSEGWRYVKEAASPQLTVILLAATAIFPWIHDTRARRRLAVLLPAAAAWFLYVVAVGGDIFPARRHLVVLIVLACFAIAEGIRWLIARSPRVRYWTIVGAIGLLGMYLVDQRSDPQNERAHEERWEWDGEVIGTFLRHHFEESDARLATDSAGALPFFSRLTTIDMLGINDRTIATTKPADFGHGALGHELGNGSYVLSREPDLVIFGLPTGERNALYRSGIEMQANPRFADSYLLITFEALGQRTVTSRVWIRTDSQRLGAVREEERIVVPGFMMAVGQAVAREDGEGRLGTMATRFAPAATRIRAVPPGRWRVIPSYGGIPLEMSLRPVGGEAQTGSPPREFVVSGDAPSAVDIALRPKAMGLSHIRALELKRMD
jgi:arabinofuranosyltransferase